MKRILVLGRFQPPHRGHVDAMVRAAKRCDELIVVIGSAQASYTPDNPFTAGERVEMVRAALEEAGVTNAVVIPVLDLNRHAEWAAYVASLVPEFDEVVTNNPLTHELFSRDGYRVRAGVVLDRARCEGTKIRSRIARGETVDDAVPASVAKILRRLRAKHRLRRLGGDGPAKPRRPR